MDGDGQGRRSTGVGSGGGVTDVLERGGSQALTAPIAGDIPGLQVDSRMFLAG